jgi:hypothetical protein
MLLRVTASAFNDRGPHFMEQALAAIHEGIKSRDAVTFTLRCTDAGVALFIGLTRKLRPLVEGQLLSQYPSARIEQVDDEFLMPRDGETVWLQTVIAAPAIASLRIHSDFLDRTTRLFADPMGGILAALAVAEHDIVRPCIEFTIRPTTKARRRAAAWAVSQLRRSRLNGSSSLRHRFLAWGISPSRWKRLIARMLVRLTGTQPSGREPQSDVSAEKFNQRLFDAHIRVFVTGLSGTARRAQAKLDEMLAALGQFADPKVISFRAGKVTHASTPTRPRGRGESLLTGAEMATLWHLPTVSLDVPTLDVAAHRRLPPPLVVPNPRREEGTVPLGRSAYRDSKQEIGIRGDDRRRHLYVVGKTGMGKSTLLQNLLGEDIGKGRGCGLIDPHGDLVEAVLAAVPSQRTNDVVLFDAGDRAYPVAFNPLADASPERRPLVASAILTAFKKIYADSWGPRMEHIFRNSLLTLLEVPGASLVSLVRLLGDARYRDTVTSCLSDPVVRAFWQQEFAGMPARLQAEAIAPIQNKCGQFVSSPLLRHILGQPRSTIDLRKIMDTGQVFLANLSKGRVGEDASDLLGALLVSSVQLAAMSRADAAEAERRDFFLYVDEFQSFATESFASILSEARKYRLCLTLANQYLAQVDEPVAAAVFGNVGSVFSFQVGAQDAELLAEQLGGQVTAADLLAVPRYEAYLRLLVDGQPSRAFSVHTMAAQHAGNPQRAEIIRRRSQNRYGRPLRDVESEIARAVG